MALYVSAILAVALWIDRAAGLLSELNFFVRVLDKSKCSGLLQLFWGTCLFMRIGGGDATVMACPNCPTDSTLVTSLPCVIACAHNHFSHCSLIVHALQGQLQQGRGRAFSSRPG